MKTIEIKVRKPRVIKFFGIANIYARYSKRQDQYRHSLPLNGEKIKITWFPDNRCETNVYIGMEGIVESMNKNEGCFALNSGNSILICSGDFNYIKL